LLSYGVPIAFYTRTIMAIKNAQLSVLSFLKARMNTGFGKEAGAGENVC
jgi:hypothetical protein